MVITELPDINTIEDELLESILISLYTDKYVPSEDLPCEMGTNGGWHGDVIGLDEAETIGADYSWGSRLWILQRAKSNEATPEIVKEMIEEALEPLLLLADISQFIISVESLTDGISFSIIVVKTNGDQTPYIFKNIGGRDV